MSKTIKTIIPSVEDVALAKEIGSALSTIGSEDETAFLSSSNGKDISEYPLRDSIMRILLNATQEISKGHGLILFPIQSEITTQNAATLLGVSHHYLIDNILQSGDLPYHMVGNLRRILFEDLIRYKEETEKEISRREKVMLEIVKETGDLGLYK